MLRPAAALAIAAFCRAQDPAALTILSQPAQLCRAMGATAWAPIMERLNPEQQSIYTCQYGVEKGPVLLRISGSHPGLADSISLSTELAQGRTSQKVKQAFQTALDQLFLALGVTAPRGLIDSITNEQRYLYHAPYGTLWFAKVHKQTAPKGETLWFRMRKRE